MAICISNFTWKQHHQKKKTLHLITWKFLWRYWNKNKTLIKPEKVFFIYKPIARPSEKHEEREICPRSELGSGRAPDRGAETRGPAVGASGASRLLPGRLLRGAPGRPRASRHLSGSRFPLRVVSIPDRRSTFFILRCQARTLASWPLCSPAPPAPRPPPRSGASTRGGPGEEAGVRPGQVAAVGPPHPLREEAPAVIHRPPRRGRSAHAGNAQRSPWSSAEISNMSQLPEKKRKGSQEQMRRLGWVARVRVGLKESSEQLPSRFGEKPTKNTSQRKSRSLPKKERTRDKWRISSQLFYKEGWCNKNKHSKTRA